MNFFKHLCKILIHKFWVMYYCCKYGIIWQGITHDISKFSFTEFLESYKYYVGTSSPINEAFKDKGYSEAWIHHFLRLQDRLIPKCPPRNASDYHISRPYL